MKIYLIGVRGVPAIYSGFETAATEICSRLVARGHDVTVYCRKGYGDESEPTYKGIKKKYFSSLRLKIGETLSHTFRSLLDVMLNPPDVLLVFNPANSPLCILPWLQKIPFAINVDGLEWQRTKWPLVGRAYLYLACWFSTLIAPKIIADSHGIQKFYREQWGRETYYATYGAYLTESRQKELLHSYELSAEEYFLVVARLEPENNTNLIVEAFKKVKTNKMLVIVGGTPYKSKYVDNLIGGANDSRIKFLGPIYNQDHLNELLCNSFAYIHGHMVGGTNPVLLQALGSGTCVLYLDHGYRFNHEVVGDAGIGFALKPESLRLRLEELLATPDMAAIYRKRAKERIRAEYTWDRVADQYEKLCCEMYKGSRRKRISSDPVRD